MTGGTAHDRQVEVAKTRSLCGCKCADAVGGAFEQFTGRDVKRVSRSRQRLGGIDVDGPW